MRRNFFSLGSLLCTLALLLTTAGCRNERPEDFYPDNGRGTEVTPGTLGQQEAEIAIDIPEMMQSTALRSLTKDQEGDASAIRILAFNVPEGVEDGAETYAYEPRIKSGPELRDGKYYVTLQVSQTTAPQRLVLLANLPDGKLPAAVTEGATKEAIYKSLVYDYAATGWKSDGEKAGATKGTDYDLLPMWGESKAITVAAGANTFGDYYYEDGVIRLYRALARVDVGMKFSTTPEPGKSLPETNEGMGDKDTRNFDLTDVYVYHPAKSYRLAGNIKNIEKADAKYKAVRPTLPEGVEYYTGKKAEELKLHYEVDPDQGRLVRSIYLPEAPVVESGVVKEELDGNPCIVVGGVYKGDNFNPKGRNNTDKTYYRVDFVKAKEEGQDKASRLPILRNHRYRINILDVDGPGHKTTEDAINNTTSDVIYSVSVWDENETSKVVTDGNYWLKLSQDQIKVGKLGGVLPITFQTNHPDGWELIVPEYYIPDPENHPENKVKNPLYDQKDWVKTLLGSVESDVEGTKSTTTPKTKAEAVNFKVKTQTDKDFKGMQGAFVVQAYGGRLNWTIRVKQTEKLDLVLEIYKDREMTTQTDFIEVHEGGISYDRSIDFDGHTYTPEEQGRYTVFYVRALPYGNIPVPSTPADQIDKNWSLDVTDAGGHDFKFWAYSKSHPGNTIEDFISERGDVDEDNFLSFNNYFAKKENTNYKGLMFRQVGKNLYELAISNDAISTKNRDPFELRRNKYTFTLTVTDPADANKKESISRSIEVLQQEHSIVLYTDEELTKRISYDEKHPSLYLMNGQEKQVYVKSNLPGYIKLLRQGQDPRVRVSPEQDPEMIPMEQIVGQTPDYKPLTIDKKTLQANISKTQDIYYFPANLGTEDSRNKYTFTTRNDIKATEKLTWGYAKWTVNTTDPFFKWKFDDGAEEGDNFRTEFLCVSVQPEANCYVLELDNFGVLIPLSRINHAADVFYKEWQKPERWDEMMNKGLSGEKGWIDNYIGPKDWGEFMEEKNHGLHHLDDNDEPTPEFIWSDVEPRTRDLAPGRKPLYDPDSFGNSKGPIKAMEVIDVLGERYLLLIPGKDTNDNVGNTLIAVRSSKHKKKLTGIPEVDNGTNFSANKFGENAILWSWHIITVPKGKRSEYLSIQKPNAIVYNKGKDDEYTLEHPGFLDKELGARRHATRYMTSGPALHMAWEPGVYDIHGMTYQFGRKDPFPNEDYNKGIGWGSLVVPHLKDANGNTFHTEWYGDSKRSYRFTYKQSIENPTVAVRANASGDEHWMVEDGWETSNGPLRSVSKYQVSYIWGGVPLGGGNRENNIGETKKTVFDPSPYGFKMPSIGYETTMYTTLTKAVGTPEGFLRDLFVSRPRPIAANGGTKGWSGPESGKWFPGTQPELWFHTASPVFGGMGRSGVFIIKTGSPFFSGTSTPGDPMPKYSVNPYYPIVDITESDYTDYFNPRARSIGISNNR
ncbi:hypothetical protein [Porphyromonas sp. HMSC065F10]|uniref:hypothetical protein n=1 Tax=Porphyromonas sp. HMSC065F10 TaxID=1739394 RepID=UPI000AA2EF2B|nr:hypothetical protein [Porphyromonas sp. HMSC065F10]